MEWQCLTTPVIDHFLVRTKNIYMLTDSKMDQVVWSKPHLNGDRAASVLLQLIKVRMLFSSEEVF